MKPEAVLSVIGTIIEKKTEVSGTVVTILVKDMKFHMFVSKNNTKVQERIAPFEVGNVVKAVSYIKNNNFDNKDGEKVYSYSFYLQDINYVSGTPCAKFHLVGRNARDFDMRHIDAVNSDYIVAGIVVPISASNNVYINVLHKELNENIGMLNRKGLALEAYGDVTINKNGYSFYAKQLFALRKD